MGSRVSAENGLGYPGHTVYQTFPTHKTVISQSESLNLQLSTEIIITAEIVLTL